jgi:hypothetical protein
MQIRKLIINAIIKIRFKVWHHLLLTTPISGGTRLDKPSLNKSYQSLIVSQRWQ